jgi:hypothetical protein
VENGKIANLVVTRGEIFDDRTTIEMVIVDGHRYSPAAQTSGAATAGGNQ